MKVRSRVVSQTYQNERRDSQSSSPMQSVLDFEQRSRSSTVPNTTPMIGDLDDQLGVEVEK